MGEDNESEDNNDQEDTAGSFEIPKRSNLFLRASRASPGGLYLRTSRDPEMIPLSLRNGMLLRSFKRGGNGLFLRASKRSSPKSADLYMRTFKRSEPGLFLR